VQPGVLERDRRLRRQPLGELPRLTVESAPARIEAEDGRRAVVVRRQVERERISLAADVADPADLDTVLEQLPAARARRLGDDLEDQRQQRALVVRRGERVADEGERPGEGAPFTARNTETRRPTVASEAAIARPIKSIGGERRSTGARSGTRVGRRASDTRIPQRSDEAVTPDEGCAPRRTRPKLSGTSKRRAARRDRGGLLPCARCSVSFFWPR
jgi:hypothetical protein